MSSPTQRSLKLLRDLGYEAQVVERYNSFSRKRTDLFGCIDIVAVKDGEILGVQTTDGSSVSKHIEKHLAEPRLRKWLSAGARFIVHGWSKRGKRGERKRWTARTVELTLEDFK